MKRWLPEGVFPSFKPFRVPFILSVLAMFGDALATALRPWPLKILIDSVISQKHTKVPFIGDWINHSHIPRMDLLYMCCGASIAIATVTGGFTYYYTKTMGEVAQRSTQALRARLFSHLQRLSLLYHDSQRTGDLLTRLTGDVGAVQDVMSSELIQLVVNAGLLIAMVGIMFWLNWQFAIVALAATPFLIWTVFHYTKRIKLSAQEARTSSGLMNSLAQETLSSIRIIQGLSLEDHQDERYRTQGEATLEATSQSLRYRARIAPLVDLMAAVGLISVMYYGTTRVLSGALTTGDVLVFFAYVTNIYAPIRALSKLSFSFAKASIGLQRVKEVLDVEPLVTNGSKVVQRSEVRGEIVFDNVTFAYPDSPPVLSGVSIRIAPGEKVAIIGATGAGKTTLTSLIPRLYDPCEGRVLLDGVDLTEYDINSLRECVGLVLQESLLFSGSIRDNIGLGRTDANFEDIQAAAVQANAHGFITEKRNGYDSYVSERGNSLSGGQKQRVAIARAILRDAPILIMDEPTSGLDAIAEETVIKALEAASRGRTTIIVAHRLSTIRFVDRIFVIENHQIVESGTPAELLALDGIYAKLCRLQFGGQGHPALRLLPSA